MSSRMRSFFLSSIAVLSAWSVEAQTCPNPPTAVVSRDTSTCGAATIDVQLTGTPPWNLTWSDGLQETGISFADWSRFVDPAVTTTYSVTAVSDAACSGSASGSATVTVTKPTAHLSGDTRICPDSSATLTVTFTGIPPLRIEWLDGFVQGVLEGTSSPVTRVVSPSISFNYKLKSVEDWSRCAGTVSGAAFVEVVSSPLRAHFVSNSIHFCPGTFAEIKLSISGEPPFDIYWSDGLEQHGAQSSVVRRVAPLVPTTYSATVTNAICSAVSAGSVTVQPDGGSCTGDLTADGLTDLLWRNSLTGQNAIWAMNGAEYVSGFAIVEVNDPNWNIVGTGDADADGKQDIFWFNRLTGDVNVWYMDGPNYRSGNTVFRLTDPDLVPVSVVRADGYGTGLTMILRNERTGANYERGATTSSDILRPLPPVADPAWRIVGAADFDKGSNDNFDLVWRNRTTGQNTIWLNPFSSFVGAALPEVNDPNWDVVAVGDYNRDTWPDLVWRNSSTGENAIWFMRGTLFVSGQLILGAPPPDWNIAAPQ